MPDCYPLETATTCFYGENMQQVMDKAERIAALNDRFRQTFWGGQADDY
jgi:hypothetical protein